MEAKTEGKEMQKYEETHGDGQAYYQELKGCRVQYSRG